MGRFSPTVLPEAAPGFAEVLANALGAGVNSYEHFKDKRQARDDRQRQLMDREDELVLHGIMPAGWKPPEGDGEFVDGSSGKSPTKEGSFAGESRPDTGGFRDLAGAMEGQPEPEAQEVTAPPQARSASGHPGGWDPHSRQFAKVNLPPPVQLPSGRVYDAGGQMRQALALKLLEQEGALDLETRKRGAQVDERRTALRGLLGQPGFEKLTPALVEAGAQDPAIYNKLVENQPTQWHPGSMAEALELSNKESEGRAAAEDRHRAPETRQNALSKGADEFAYRAVASTYQSDPAFFDAHPELLPRYAQDAGAQDMASAQRLGVNRTHYYSASRRFADRLTAKSKQDEGDDAWAADVSGTTKDPTTTHARNLPSQQSAPAGEAPTSAKGDIKLKGPRAPDSLLNELDQDMGGDLEKIRTELKKRGYDPDA